MAIETSEWLNPVRDDAPTGDDVSFSDVFDKIREARRADDPDLPQGDWEHELKTANWREVINLAGAVLVEQSKDLQAAVWLGEALIAQHGLDGARGACELLAELMDRYWDEMYPRVEDDDLDERAGKLAWFNDYAAQAVSAVPLAPGEPPYTLLDWHVSREVDNLSRQNAEAFQEAVGEGKPTGEIFDKAVESNPDAVLREQYELSTRAMAAFERFKAVCDVKLGVAGPSLNTLQEALKRILQILGKAARAKGLIGAEEAAEAAGEGGGEAGAAAGSFNLGGNDGASKAAAIRALGEIAAWFKRVEPHSPVSFLLERAVLWADTPLDQWLAEVVPDESTLAGIRSRIGLPNN